MDKKYWTDYYKTDVEMVEIVYFSRRRVYM